MIWQKIIQLRGKTKSKMVTEDRVGSGIISCDDSTYYKTRKMCHFLWADGKELLERRVKIRIERE